MLSDPLGRPLRNLRLSVTDRCNLRCVYCMPEEHYVWLPREDLLRFEEISTLVDLFVELGVDKVRLTGGEPLLRRNLPDLVRMLAAKAGLHDLAMTTNGVRLAGEAAGLHAAGLHRVTVSLDTLRRDRFRALTRFDEIDAVKEGIDAAARLWGEAGPRSSALVDGARDSPEAESLRSRPRSSALGGGAPSAVKIDTVVIRGVNDDELVDLIEFGKARSAEVRFIEYMDVGGATRWSPGQVVPRHEIVERLARHYGAIESLRRPAATATIGEDSAPAERFKLEDGTVFGIISSTTDPFCRSCDRSRLTADGVWYLCLYAENGVDLRAPLRRRESADCLRTLITHAWERRRDRGAEERLALGDRRAFVPLQALREDPHLEMHTRGG